MATFGIDKTPETNQNLTQSYTNLSISGVTASTDPSIKLIKANCQGGSGANVTYTKSNIPINYKASQLGIYGKLHKINGVSYDGELVIKNIPTTNTGINPPIYMCFLLSSNSGNTPTDIDNKIIHASGNTTQSITIATDSANAKYIVYKTTDSIGTPSIVAIFITPIQIKGPVSGYSAICEWFGSSPTTSNSDYSILQNTVDGDWMECDYVPIDSEQVTTYSLPIQSHIIKDASSMDSLRTIIMFVVFFIICVFSYILIPVIYLAVIAKLFAGKQAEQIDPVKKKKTILYMDYILSFILGGMGIILICVGAFSDPTKVENTGDILMAGFSISIIYIISYIVIQSKKLGGGKFVPGVNYVENTQEETA